MTELKKSKVLLLGASGAGKSALMQRSATVRSADLNMRCSRRISQSSFRERYLPTLGAELFSVETFHKSDKSALSVWDCGGHERFRPIVQQLYSGAKAGSCACCAPN